MKRVFDLLLSSAALVVLSPVLVGAAMAIKIASPGPALFWQQRVGWRGKPFWLLKFRTMRVRPLREAGGSTTVAGDPRIFPLGQRLRRWKVDELPQLVNVLRGEMSLVGPRPTVDEDHQRMTPNQRRRIDVRPGLTGLAQLRGGAAIPWPQRIEHDLAYIRDQSLALDAQLIAETVWQLFTGDADRMPTQFDEWSEAA